VVSSNTLKNFSISHRKSKVLIGNLAKNFIIIFYNINLILTYSTSNNKAYNVTTTIQNTESAPAGTLCDTLTQLKLNNVLLNFLKKP